MSSPTMTVATGLLLMVISGQTLVGMFGIGGGYWSVASPAPVWLVAQVLGGAPLFLVIAVPTVCFWLWHPQLFRGSPLVPSRTLVLFGVAAVFSAVWYWMGWQYGVKYQGRTHVIVCLSASVALLSLTAWALALGRRNPTFVRALMSHVLFFAWLSSYAFPYLGEAL